jgi:hypothetical protein
MGQVSLCRIQQMGQLVRRLSTGDRGGECVHPVSAEGGGAAEGGVAS